MGIRFFARLPGPFVLTGRSRTERRVDRELDRQQQERELTRWNNLTPAQQQKESRTTAIAVSVVVCVVVLGLGAACGVGWFIGAVVLVGLYVWWFFGPGSKPL